MSEHPPDGKTPKQGAGSAINAMAEHKNKRRQMRLKSKPHRQEAIAAWPLMVADMAYQMQHLLSVQKLAMSEDEARQGFEAIDYLEKKIRDSFIHQRRVFLDVFSETLVRAVIPKIEAVGSVAPGVLSWISPD